MDQTLSVTDLAVLKNIIDIACARGAFRANEMKSVGETYDKLSTFLDTIVTQANAASSPDSQASQGEIT